MDKRVAIYARVSSDQQAEAGTIASQLSTIRKQVEDDAFRLVDEMVFSDEGYRGAYLICAARGGVIDETALLNALESGQISGAALDVFSTEPPGLTALVAHPNVVTTPHIGAQTAEAQVRAAVDISEEILAALKGEPLRWKIV